MKTFFKLLTLLLSVGAFGQLQRLAVMPQQSATITHKNSGIFKTLSIDYYRDAPNAQNLSGQKYNQVYLANNVTIRINGQPSNRTFQALVQTDSLLLLVPKSERQIVIVLNPKNTAAKSIESIDLSFNSPAYVGSIANDRDVIQPQVIFANWGLQIKQEAYWRYAKCLDIMTANKLLDYGADFLLTPNSKAAFDKLYAMLDFYVFSGKTFKNLVSNNYFVTDGNLKFTEKSVQQLEQAFYYVSALSTTKDINEHWKINYGGNPYDPANIEKVYAAKQAFYQQSKNLMPVVGNNSIQDTVINGARYVLMTAWKTAASFNALVKKDPVTNMLVYKSDTTLFSHAFFMVVKRNMQEWLSQHDMTNWTEDAYRTRFMQLLGLPPSSANNIFVEFWALEADFFRPTIDPGLTSSALPYKLDPLYLKGFEGYSAGSFAGDNLLWQYPFTGLGFTWDYNPTNPTHFGLSEFVLYPDRTIYIRREVPTKDYLSSYNK